LAATQGTRLDDATLRTTLSGATLAFGETATGGPYEAQFAADGVFTIRQGSPPTMSATGTWEIRNNRVCRMLKDTRCYTVVADRKDLLMFDPNGLMQYVMRLRP
jgi:hypothetical protein